MARLAQSARGAGSPPSPSPWPLACALLFLGTCVCAGPSSSRARGRLVCWQAIMNCQAEPECHYAYGQYVRACDPVLSGRRRSCPSHCIASLVQLNQTKSGPALEDCSCADDQFCRETKRAIEPCLPRTSSMGCTEARRQCERDGPCRAAMGDYLQHCGKLFSGAMCTSACRGVIAHMRRLPKAQQLDTCVCDGAERTICEYVKVSMDTLCFGMPPVVDVDGSGRDGDDEDDDGGEDDIEDSQNSARKSVQNLSALAVLAPILVLLRFW
ncbi:growth arrest-specific protein 1a [Clarias gariepinus]|uniref:growth arrest-specific protein 1a n=1 Tax=Clarias gariepinus TaxID=13013 RepID=UPI00234D1903|nr:growth arrest-specific protein 1a [Clarias gariepinus]